MKIDKNKPLPPHTKRSYWECYAKIVLEDLFASDFSILKIDDEPDLQDCIHGIGIEVTRAIDARQAEAESLYSNMPYRDEAGRIKAVRRIEQLGARVYDGLMVGIKGTDSFDAINIEIQKKIDTIAKGHYQSFKEFQLFIFSSILADSRMLTEELQYLLNNDIARHYKIVYVLVPGEMYRFNLKRKEYVVIEVTSKKQHKHSMSARRMVEEGEEH